MKLKHSLYAIAMLCTMATLLTVLPARAGPYPTSTDEARALPRSIAELMTMKPMEVMHMIDREKKGVVTKEEFMSFFEALYDRMDKSHSGKVNKDDWMVGWGNRNR